jgi:multisubunit Na+/H+ antiporter MnhE subunit
MAQAAAMLMGLAALWFMLSPSFEDAGAAVIAGACIVAAFAGARRLIAANVDAPLRERSWLRRALEAVRAEGRVAVAAILPGARLKPAFVKIKTKDDRVRAALALAAAAHIGGVIVEMEADGFLLHTLDEDGVDARALRDIGAGSAAGESRL